MTDDVILNKAATIERCIKRVQEEFLGGRSDWQSNVTRQDAIILNLQRACEAAIDMGARVIRLNSLGLPRASREVFTLLAEGAFIDEKLSETMQNMVGFRNIAVHDYTSLNMTIVEVIIQKHLDDFLAFSSTLIKKT